MGFVGVEMLSNMFDRVNVGRETGQIDQHMEEDQGEKLQA